MDIRKPESDKIWRFQNFCIWQHKFRKNFRAIWSRRTSLKAYEEAYHGCKYDFKIRSFRKLLCIDRLSTFLSTAYHRISLVLGHRFFLMYLVVFLDRNVFATSSRLCSICLLKHFFLLFEKLHSWKLIVFTNFSRNFFQYLSSVVNYVWSRNIMWRLTCRFKLMSYKETYP